MIGNVITLVINLLSAVQWIEKDEELQRKILEIVRDQINLALQPRPTIADLRSVYEQQGKIPAIKEWRTINAGMGLKDAKEAIEAAASLYRWNECRIGLRVTINHPDSKWHGRVAHVAREADNGFYVTLPDRGSELFFHKDWVQFG